MKRYLYWMDEADFRRAAQELPRHGLRLVAATRTQCQVLKAHGDEVRYAPPAIWSGMCHRQGSWYRASERAGQTMVMSASPLPEAFDRFLDAELSTSDFEPDRLPADAELRGLVESGPYQEAKPPEWERVGRLDALLFKLLFTLKRFWGRGDNLAKHWLGHRANHANFLARRFTTEMDGEAVAYSVTGNAGVCSSCVEFFNVVTPDSRKLVRACPGSVIFAGAQRDIYYDVKPRARSAPGGGPASEEQN